MEKIIEKLKEHKRLIKYIGLILILLLSGLILKYADQLRQLQNYGYFGIFLINLLGSTTIIFPIPALVTAFIGGAVFNPLMVGIAGGVGAAIGESTGFYVGHTGKAVVENKKKYERVEKWMKKYGPITIFFLALVPNPLFDIAGIASGITGVPYYQFLTFTILGKTLRYILIAYAGAGSFDLFGSL